ncbi:MAG: ArnT family glycosyltransferase, partial [Desulfomonilaceae bacterium]
MLNHKNDTYTKLLTRPEKILGNSGPVFILLTIYLAFVIIRFAVSLLFQYPLCVTDELLYKSMALSYFNSGSFYNISELGFPGSTPPNVLYPLLISPCFWFGQNFFTAIKLINALIMNLAIFPLYLLTREFLNKKDTLIICVIILTLPCFNYINVAMVEASIFTLFLTCFYLAFKCMSTMSLKYAALTGLFLLISFFTKTTALLSVVSIMFAYFVLMVFYPKTRLFSGISPMVVSIGIILSVGLISYLLLKHEMESVYYTIGNRIESFLSVTAVTVPPLGEVIQMILAHLDTILLTYLIPFWVMILALVGA